MHDTSVFSHLVIFLSAFSFFSLKILPKGWFVFLNTGLPLLSICYLDVSHSLVMFSKYFRLSTWRAHVQMHLLAPLGLGRVT